VGRCHYSYQVGVYGFAYDSTGTAIKGYNWYGGNAVVGKGYTGVGVYGYVVAGTYGIGVKAVNRSSSKNAAALLANCVYYYGNPAVFQTYGKNVARISPAGGTSTAAPTTAAPTSPRA
jgi:hypothetical protein